MEQKYNLKSPAVKRLMREAFEMKDATEEYFAQPLEDNLFEWHFTVRGPPETDFDGGVYHGRIIMPPEYPMKPPTIILLTMNGRFEINQKICLSISGHHPETWQPSWSIRTVLLAIIGFMPTPGNGAIGSLDYTPQERWALAKKSGEWRCPQCGPTVNLLGKPGDHPSVFNQEAKKLAAQISFKGESDKSGNMATDFQDSQDGPVKQPQPSASSSGGSTLATSTPEQLDQPASVAVHQRRTVNGSTATSDVQPSNITAQPRANAVTLFLGVALGVAIAVVLVRRVLLS